MSDQTTTTDEPRPVYSDPNLIPGWDDDGNPLNETDCRWDLAFGCALSFGHDDDGIGGGPLHVTVSTSDAHQRDGITVRTVTPEQVAEFGRMLCDLGSTDVVTQWWMGDRAPDGRAQPITTRTDEEHYNVRQMWRGRGPGLTSWMMFRRTVTTLPDGSALTSPWVDVEAPNHA